MKHLTRLLLTLTILTLCSPALAQNQKGKWPLDAMDVSYTFAALLSGQRGMSNITFAPGVENYLHASADGEYTTFTRSAVTPMIYENHGAGNTYTAEVSGAIHLFDPDGRLVTFQYLAQYSVDGKSITVTEALASMSSPSNLALETYMVPTAEFKQGVPADMRGDWSSVYNFAKANSYTPSTNTTAKRQYLVLTFVMNRLPEDAQFEAIVSSRKKASRSRDNLAKKNEFYLDYDGWRIHMFAAELLPTSMRGRFYSNYYYTPGAGFPEETRKRIHVARYDSKPATGQSVSARSPQAPTRAAAVPPPPVATAQPAPAASPRQAARPAPSAGSDGPLGMGTTLLNPIFPEDVALIQQRLKQLGHYGGAIDKKLGGYTKKALDNFAVKHGFPKGQWSLGLQKALFRGSGM